MPRIASLSVLVALLLVGPALADEKDIKEVMKSLNALNKAFEKGDAKAAMALMTKDHVSLTPTYGGPKTLAQEKELFSQLKLTQYKTTNMKARALGKDSVLVTFDAAFKGTYKGKPVPPKAYASSIWVRKDGKWLEAYYQETEAK